MKEYRIEGTPERAPLGSLLAGEPATRVEAADQRPWQARVQASIARSITAPAGQVPVAPRLE